MKIPLTQIIEHVCTLYPEFITLKLTEVSPQGHDHRSYRMGHRYVLRIPSQPEYASQVIKECEVLPKIYARLSLEIPKPVLLLEKGTHFPMNIGIYTWIDGDVLSTAKINPFELVEALSIFLVELRSCPIDDKWLCGQHNFYRGAHISVYEDETRLALKHYENLSQKNAFEDLLNRALKTYWDKSPVFVHGDIAVNNLLTRSGKLVACIDFGSCGLGDPACDYVMAWTFFNKNERVHFRNLLNIDQGTWLRSSAWALWKALISLNDEKQKAWALATLEELYLDLSNGSL
jgi:aminoglycoside phosphotransferase (APT) family kinase protein